MKMKMKKVAFDANKTDPKLNSECSASANGTEYCNITLAHGDERHKLQRVHLR